MKRILIALIAVSLLLTVSCAPTLPTETPTLPIPTPGPSNQQDGVTLPDTPPDDVTWISPGKVHVGNFHPGARAEWELLVHNGRQELTPKGQPTGIFLEAQFAITYRHPDHVGDGYVKPTSVVQDWIIIADANPVIAPLSTRGILIVLEMPQELKDNQVIFWQITPTGELFLSTIKKELHTVLEEEALKQEDPEVRDELLKQIPGKVREALLADPTTNLLLYLKGKGSVSLEDFGEQRSDDTTLIIDLHNLGHASTGDLREDSWEFWISVMDTTQTGMVQTELASRWLVSMR